MNYQLSVISTPTNKVCVAPQAGGWASSEAKKKIVFGAETGVHVYIGFYGSLQALRESIH